MMSYGSDIFFGGSDNVLEWDKPQCIFKFEKKLFSNDPSMYVCVYVCECEYVIILVCDIISV